jgi:predicted nucleic acid-binding protein
MAAGVILDTSFLITLADPARKHHDAARRYWRYFTENALPMYLPTIVVSEFYIKQSLPPEILRACVVLPFNWDDAIKAASLDFSKADRQGASRDALKDDVKIIAQAVVKDAAFLITDDSSSFYKFAEALVSSGTAQFRPIKLEDGFDLAFFNQGQRELNLRSEDEEAESP